MDKVMIKSDLQHSKLEEIGYSYSILEGGFISADNATIIFIMRSPYERQVAQFIPNVESKHMANIEKLREIDAIE